MCRVDRELLASAEGELQGDGESGEVSVGRSPVIARSVSFTSRIVSAPVGCTRAARRVSAAAVKDSSSAGRASSPTRPTGSRWVWWSWARACHRSPSRSWGAVSSRLRLMGLV
ncbi:hypothetical protein AQJ30_07320 [Streptomyces longwoodensis]|uniref:Uncharacterized protein n=1 Tax=Streptomyces longwoodensis TaxID=68231 RepID=A0A101R2H2_9ACTN|nr:hypothetical protein AQJ30_07320 [Streptomyces longwoodensis]